MSTRIQRRGGTAAEHASFTGATREVTVDTTDYTLRVHDGSLVGGHRLAKTSEVADDVSTINSALALKANTADLVATPVSYGGAQGLTAEQEGRARANIGADRITGFRNKIVDGAFDFWSQATSHTASGYGSADMWSAGHAGSTKTFSRQAFTIGQTDVPGNPDYYARTVVSSVAGAANQVNIATAIEGVETLSGQTATLTFWAKADASKNIAVDLAQYFGTGGSPSATVNAIGAQQFALTTSWQKFSVAIAIPSVSGKTLGSNDNDAIYLLIWFDAGSDLNARTASLGQQSGTFDIARVSLVEGDATAEDDPHPAYDKGIESNRVCRYFEKTFIYGQAYYQSLTANAADYIICDVSYKTQKRNTPTLTLFSTGVGTYVSAVNDTRYCAFKKTGVFTTALSTGVYADARL